MTGTLKRPLLGAIADDMTGATDLALMLAKGGMKVVQVIGPDAVSRAPHDTDAIVVAMKSRTNPPEEAVAMSLQAAAALKERGSRQILFKYCSTFDSTDQGNIGPVADALLDHLDTPVAVACPAFPAAGRTIYHGHLFVNGRLLSESGMQHHPLTPMTDPDLVRVLSRQSRNAVGLIPLEVVARGTDAIREGLATLAAQGKRLVIVDAVSDADLRTIGHALNDARLITGGSGIALGLPDNFRDASGGGADSPAPPPAVSGPAAILSGSCSQATNQQVDRARKAGLPAFRVRPEDISSADETVARLMDWVAGQPPETPILIHATDTPENVQASQVALGRDAAGALVEQVMGKAAVALVGRGFRRLIVAGGETSGAVIAALSVRALRIGPEIAPGVPWTTTIGDPELALALKSGNFGGPDFFADALAMLDE
ncbi:3-oxo-tetronate kinase [Minwuia sp.]|uniref:3-oxo-tetronate kinase n=1 Tax=Minwuia sp. TaxID=2493630 RepID=UPI003A8DED71